MNNTSGVAPTEIRQKNKARMVEIAWGEVRFEFTFEYLRVFCPCAACCGHHPSQKQLIHGKRDVLVTAITPVGHYAVRIGFNDGHDSGVYSWETLRGLGDDQEANWAGYLAELKAKGKSRFSLAIKPV